MNNNGLHLIHISSELGLTFGNTFFRHKMKHKVTWILPRSKQDLMFDILLTQKADSRYLRRLRVLRSADCDTDHKMVRVKLKFRVSKNIRNVGVRVLKKIDVE